MTTQYSMSRAISGQTGTSVKLFAVNGDTVLYTADTVVERTNAKGQYLATFGEVAVIPAGNYTQIHFSSGGIPLSIGDRTFIGTDGETATEIGAVLDSSRQQVIDDLGAMITGSGTPDAKFDTVALSNAPGSSGGLTTPQNDALMGIAAAVSGSSKIEATGRVAAGGKVTAYVGDDFRVRSGTALSIPVSDPAGTLYTKLTAITIANLRFAVSGPGKVGSLITGTISGITSSGSGASRLCLIAVEITNCGASLPPGDNYFYQVDQIQNTSDDFVEVEGKFWLKQRARTV